MTAKATGMDWIASDHKLGRTLFATEAVNAGLDPAVREFDLMHKTDQFGGTYVQFHKTAKGEELIRREPSWSSGPRARLTLIRFLRF